MWLIKASLRNPHMVAALVPVLLVLGGLSLTRIPIDILPVFNAPAVQVLTYYPGMPASSIEKTITNRIERWVSQAPGTRRVESRSVPGVSVVKVYFRDDVDPNEALTLVNSLALGAMPNLPPNTLPPVAMPFDATGTLPVGILTVTNLTMDDARQKDVARINVRNMLGAVPGCIAPVVVGGKDRAVMVYLDPSKLDARGMAPMDVVSALRRANMMVSPGTAYFGDNQLLLDSNAMPETVAEFNDFPVTATVQLRDVGRAEDASTIQMSRVRINDRNEVFVPVYRQRGASSLAVVDGVRSSIPSMEDRLPQGTRLALVMDQTVSVRAALTALLEEGLVGAALVSIMILLFLGDWRMTIIASTCIPLAVLGAIIGLYATGNTLNTMTLAGLALAIGPLVDDAIVELENNHRNHAMGKSRVRAALDGCAEVMVPVLVATCTTVIVLSPLALMPGIGGFLFRPLTVAVGFAMLTSFLLSRTFVPMLCARFLPETSHDAGLASDHAEARVSLFTRVVNRFGRAIDGMVARYTALLDHCLDHRGAVAGAIVALFVGSLALLPFIGREFFPQIDAGQIMVRLRCPSNLKLDASEKRVKDVERFIKETIPQADREMIVSEVGLNPDWSAAYTTNAGQQDALIRLQLRPTRARSAQQYAALLRQRFNAEPRFNDLRVDFDTSGMISTALNLGASAPLDIEVIGAKWDDVMATARRIRDRVASLPGAADVRVSQRDDAPYLTLEVDRQKAIKLGLTAEDVMQQVVVAMNSSVSVQRSFWIDAQSGNQYFVGVQYPEDAGRTLEDVLSIPVKGAAGGTSVNLGTLVTPRRKAGAVEVTHADLRRVANVQVSTDGAPISTVAEGVQRIISQQSLPTGVRLTIRGEYERMGETFRLLGLGLALAIVLVYLLQVTLFRSWTGPLVIMATVPLGFIGVLWMLFVTGTTLNVQSLMGVIFLVGIAVNNGVLLVDFANRNRGDDEPARDAIRRAAAVRLRPILMTFLATVLALAPMALGGGRGGEANVPLARAVVGGLVSSTALTLFMVPILYTVIVRRKPTIDARLAAELGDLPYDGAAEQGVH